MDPEQRGVFKPAEGELPVDCKQRIRDPEQLGGLSPTEGELPME